MVVIRHSETGDVSSPKAVYINGVLRAYISEYIPKFEQQTVQQVAMENLLNDVYQEGVKDTKKRIREALGID
ncbi:MAG: hypothetical protein PVI43_00440 [Candidatus Bathyarchaeota archaeon]|jgi:hypothetical protein